MDLVIHGALDAANVAADQIDHADIYSCFPCVVDQAATQLNRKEKPMTLTGGLPFFGGPGNNYTLHAICEVVTACRRVPGSIGLAHGNGGWMSKQAVGLYSADWKECDVFADERRPGKPLSPRVRRGWRAILCITNAAFRPARH
jgi:acetyl-CoA C-acetyltransferase